MTEKNCEVNQNLAESSVKELSHAIYGMVAIRDRISHVDLEFTLVGGGQMPSQPFNMRLSYDNPRHVYMYNLITNTNLYFKNDSLRNFPIYLNLKYNSEDLIDSTFNANAVMLWAENTYLMD
ncbi:hypothetical protein SME17J_47220 (plasmid) [Serratia marcescens]|nr:hypothetical protein SME17J_47220 [Serratia marcescens]